MSRSVRWLLARRNAWPIHLALAALVLPRAAFLGESLFDRDIHLDWYPRALVFARTVRAGLWPLWDLSVGFGQPLLADPSGQVLYPTTWLAAALDPSTLYTVFALLHLVLAGAGTTRLARASGLRGPEAAVAGAVFMLSGPVVSFVNLWHHFASLAWMPWVLVAVNGVVRRPDRRSAARLGLALGLQVLAGSADVVLMTALAAGAWALAVASARVRRRLGAVVGWGSLGVLLGAALSAGQWVPAVELASRAARRALPVAVAGQWSVPPAGLLRTALPLDGSGRVALAPAAQRALLDSDRTPIVPAIYFGAVPLALAGTALIGGRRRRLAWTLAGLALFAALAALGPHTPLFDALRRLVPGASSLRYPSKAMVVPAVACAILAGHGLAALRRRRPELAGVAAAISVALALLLAVAATLFGPAWSKAIEWGLLLQRDGAAEDALPWAARFAAHAALALVAAAFFLRDRGAGLARGSTLAVGLCVAADLLLAHYDANATAPRSMLRFVPPVFSAVDSSAGGRLYVYEYAYSGRIAQARLGHEAPYGVMQPPAGVDPRPLAALALRIYPLPPVSGSWNVEGSYDLDLRGLQPLAQKALTQTLPWVEGTPAHLNLLRVGAVRTIVALHRRGLEAYTPGPSFPSLFREPILTFGVPGTLPRARAVGRARALEGERAVAALLAPDFDAASEVVLSGHGAARAAAQAKPGPASVRLVELRAGRVRAEVELAEPGILVLADAFDPGWRAWIDGRPADVLVANVAFRAVAVPAGRHVVEMRYRPTSVALGLSSSAAGLIATVLLWRRRSRAPRREEA